MAIKILNTDPIPYLINSLLLSLMLTLQSKTSLNKILTRSLLTVALTTIGLVSGVVPSIHKNTVSLQFDTAVFAQEFSNQQIRSYAQVVLDMESARQTVIRNIERIIGRKPAEIPCYNSRTLRELPRDAEELARKYCTDYQQAIERQQGLDVSSFNEITAQAQTDANLKRRIQNAMIEIQQQR